MNLRKAKKTIAIIGLGYVGLPLLNKFIQSKKYEVIGIDNNHQRIDSLKKGKSYISHISNVEIKLIKDIYLLTFNDNINVKKENPKEDFQNFDIFN